MLKSDPNKNCYYGEIGLRFHSYSVFKGTTSGTKYHNKPRDTKLKMWYEAKTEAGVTYYWHVETKRE